MISLIVLFSILQPIAGAADFYVEVKDIWLDPGNVKKNDYADIKFKMKNLADYTNGFYGFGTYDFHYEIWKPSGSKKSYYTDNYEYHPVG